MVISHRGLKETRPVLQVERVMAPGGPARLDFLALDLKNRHSWRMMVERLFTRDFDQMVGFPAEEIRAPKGTASAFVAVGEYLQRNLGLQVEITCEHAAVFCQDCLDSSLEHLTRNP
jgi:hypothetical protein